MKTVRQTTSLVLAVSGGAGLEASPHQVAAAARAGGVGVLDLGAGDAWSLRVLARAARRAGSGLGVRVTAACTATPADLERVAGTAVELVIVTADSGWDVAELAARHRVLVEVASLAEAHAAVAAGAHGLVARGMESGGRVSELSSFVLLQQLVGVGVPVWAAGGIGPHTAAACVVGGAAGVLLDTQLLLLSESTLPDRAQALIRRMDGTETVLRDGMRGLDCDGVLLPVGQDGWLAADFAKRYADTATAVRGIRDAVLDALGDPDAGEALRPGAPLARTLGVELPVAQGPMTRVSDVAGFAGSVADGGALPFIALALANAEQTRRMLTEAAATLGDRPWGVGVLGFARNSCARRRSRSSGRSGPRWRSSPAAVPPRPRGSRPTASARSCTCRRPGCCGSSSRPAPASSSSRAPSAAATSGRAPASRCGRRNSAC
ncbi:hypothetical protein Asp14428_54270 [Actinoplanes sp. NBRC 14428]|nr:hypothetical protein Asp14428_54270 [Actinoplanes sp. NBRC 14428]